MSQIAEADKYSNLNKTVMNMLNRPSFGWWALFIFDLMFLAFGIYCFIYQVYTGLGVAGYSHPVLWGVYMLSSCMESTLYGRRDIRNHSDMIGRIYSGTESDVTAGFTFLFLFF